MKKKIFVAVTLLVTATASLGGYSYYQQSQLDPTIAENLELLALGETRNARYKVVKTEITRISRRIHLDTSGKDKLEIVEIGIPVDCFGGGDLECKPAGNGMVVEHSYVECNTTCNLFTPPWQR